ncbi:MAG: TolC family protein [Magnetococcales bacterium]|nr:TolC family protein [Magnetococcales bacterium]
MKRFALALLAAMWMGQTAPAQAEECRVLAERMLERHPRLDASRRDVQAAKANVSKVRGGWFPELKTNAVMGPESRKPANGGTPTDLAARTLTMTLNQVLWDFGKTNAEVTKASLALLQSELTLNNQQGDLLLDAATSCINLLRSYRALALAEQSVNNIRKQTGLEESRVELGGGLETDALQARSQLSGAQARLARAKGGLNTAINHFRVLFNQEPGPSDRLYELQNPTQHLPETLDKVLETVMQRNLQIELAKTTLATSQIEQQRVVGADLAPRVGAVVEKKYKEDAEGISGNQQELSARVEMSYPFNFGLAGFHALEGAREGIAAADSRLTDARQLAEEQARNGWESISTTRENAEFLDNQARIAAEFLRMAREERLHGARSLIDVLSGETGLINAQSDALAAVADVTIAQFGLLKTMGLLNLEMLNTGPRFELPKVESLDAPPAPASSGGKRESGAKKEPAAAGNLPPRSDAAAPPDAADPSRAENARSASPATEKANANQPSTRTDYPSDAIATTRPAPIVVAALDTPAELRTETNAAVRAATSAAAQAQELPASVRPVTTTPAPQRPKGSGKTRSETLKLLDEFKSSEPQGSKPSARPDSPPDRTPAASADAKRSEPATQPDSTRQKTEPSPATPHQPTAATPESTELGEVTVIRDARLRAAPNMRSRVIRTAEAGEVLPVLEESPNGGDWLRVEENLWIATQMVSRKKTTAPASSTAKTQPTATPSSGQDREFIGIVTTLSHVRAQPDVASESLARLPSGTKVWVVNVSPDGKWWQLEDNRWIAASLVKRL